jgi:hypothetical protein
MSMFYLKICSDTTDNRVNENGKVNGHHSNYSDLGGGGLGGEHFKIQMCSKNPLQRKCALLSQKERNARFSSVKCMFV